MIEKLRTQDFDAIYHLMEMSFPSDEYRTYEEQKALLNNPVYSIYALYEEAQDIKGFIAVWGFDKFAFIEHFAVNPEHRDGGIGANMLNELVELIGKTICLEVEPPDTELAGRRIGFYKRNNFFFNEYPYMQPPISQGKNAIPLFIMTSGNEVDEDTFEQIKSTLYTKVYMEERITLCGDNCIECPRYNAHSEEELRNVAELWYKVGWRDRVVSNKEISCQGCSSHKQCTYQLVECIKEHNVTKCNQCKEFQCDKIKEMLKLSAEYKKRCRSVCTEQEYNILEKAFFEKENNLKK